MTEVQASSSSRSVLMPWQQHKLLRELAAGERTSADLAREYGITPQGIRAFKARNRAAIEEIAAHAADEFAGLWIADKSQRLAAHQNDYELALSHKAADHHEWVRSRTLILHACAEELGQLPPRTMLTTQVAIHIVEGVSTEDLT